jgi:ParB family transcriptional regulator, chromosome partitioning protein
MLSKIDVEKILPNPDQPRKHFDLEALRELADSIKANGLLQPITVRPLGSGQYQIVAGERRWRAHCLLHKAGEPAGAKVLCHVKKMDEQTRDIQAIIENLQRVDVTPLEEADAFARLVDAGMTAAEISAKTGAALFRVKWRLQLRNLEPSIRKLLEAGQIDRQAAMEIARLDSHQEQLRMLRLVNRGSLVGWKAIRNAVETAMGGEEQADIFGPGAPAPSANEIATVNRMERKIDQIAALASHGWKDGECITANRVNPDRAKLMADKLAAIEKSLRVMERELRNVTAQAVAVLAA